jgi:hypothetical protein
LRRSGRPLRRPPERPGVLQGPDPPHRLAAAELRERVREPGSVREGELGVELEEGDKDESATRHLGMRDLEAIRFQLEIAEEQHVDVERARAVTGTGEHPALLGLDRLAAVQELVGLEVGRDADRGVEEVGLVEDLADRLGLIGRRGGLDADAVLGEEPDRRPQMLRAIPDVRAEPEVSLARRRAQSGSSSPAGASRVTSTATSSIASGSGGSGFAARTVTDSHP